MNYIDIAKEVLRVEANELLNACAKVGDNFEKATNLISSISGKLIITGVCIVTGKQIGRASCRERVCQYV